MGACCVSKETKIKDIEKEVEKLFTYESPPKYTQYKYNKNIKDNNNNLPSGYNISKPNRPLLDYNNPEYKKPLIVEYVNFDSTKRRNF
jgi:hypothetical protein